MSAIANLRGAPAALPPVNLHAHGHKKGGHVQAADDAGSGSAAQVPPGLRQNLFGSLLNSLQQVIGVQLTAPTAGGSANGSAAGSQNAATAGTTANAASTASAATASVQSSITLLQNYLSNLAHNSHTDGSPAAKFAGSTVSVSA